MANGVDPNTAASQSTPPIEAGFFGANPVAYRIDPNGTLRNAQDPLPSGSRFASGATPMATVTPLYFHAPAFFVKQSKPVAYCKIGLQQRKPLQPMTSSLSWSVIYSLISQANQDITSQDLSLSQGDIDKLSNIPLPSGRGRLNAGVYAIIGGDPSKFFQIIFNTFGKLSSIAGGPATQALLTIPASEINIANQFEALIQQVVQAFTPGQQMQCWINSNPVNIAATSGASDGTSLRLAFGSNSVIVIPAFGNPRDSADNKQAPYENQVDALVGHARFTFGSAGIAPMSGGNNPFDGIPYIALDIELDDTP